MKIDNVKIKNFKSLRNIDINLSNLTLITGVNSTGKSSFIQAILLLKQNIHNLQQITTYNMLNTDNSKNQEMLKYFAKMNENITLLLDGEYVSLGNKKDILYQEVFEEDIDIEIYSKDVYLKTHYNNKLEINIEITDTITYLLFNLFQKDFQYIMTDRVSPSITYPLSELNIKNNLIGFRGEYTAHYLAENRHKILEIDDLKHKNSETSQLLENVSLWLSEISSGIDIDSTINPAQNNVTLTYRYKYSNGITNKYNPLNVGFGITYVLPIIVAILKSKPNDLLIIENPESHLHPKGQSKIAELCAIASANGVQIIVETHSEHFLNGIRIATKKEKDLLTPEQSKVYYFRKEKDELETKIDEINIDKDGGIDSYPKGFFDQFDEDLDKLITW